MQTFLPSALFTDTARLLDNRRLGKQRVETYQILRALSDPHYGWQNHPATRMWRGHTNALVVYGLAVCDEWVRRGYRDTMRERIAAFRDPAKQTVMPMWLGDERFHAAHRAALLVKAPEHYGKFGWCETPKIEYVWPI